MSSLANVFILLNLASLVVIISKAVMGLPNLLLEGLGAAIGLSGALICADAHSSTGTLHSSTLSATSKDEQGLGGLLTRTMFGNLIAFLASLGAAAHVSCGRKGLEEQN